MFKTHSWNGLWAGWLLALLVFLPLAALATPAGVVVVNDGQTSVPVVGVVDYLVEENGVPLTRDQVQDPSMASRWTRFPGRHLNLVIQKLPVWVRFNVESRAQRNEWLLNVNSPLLEQVALQQYSAASGWSATQHGGIKVQAKDKLLKHHEPVFALAIKKGETTTVLMRVHTESSFTAPLTLWEPQAFEAHRFDAALSMGLLFGILGVMLLYNATLFAFTRDRSYFVYSVYLLSIVLYELAATGLGPLYVWGGSAWTLIHGYEFFACISFLMATVFFRQFLELKTSAARHVRMLNTVLITYWLVAMVMVLTWRTEAWFYGVGLVGLLSGVAAIYSSIVLITLGVRSARYFAIAWAAIVAGTTLTLLAMYGAIESSWLTDNGQHVGFVIETVLLSIALADRIKRDRLQRERAQRESLALGITVQHEREEKIKAQEEAIAIQRRANEELELRVLDRTSEVERAMKNLEIANIELAKLSVTDALTKVHNRRYFDDVLKREHDRSARTGVPLALLLADIDHFKKINDTCGHLAGDECLRLVAATMAQTVGRSTDLIARYGGEEFALVLPATGPEQAIEVAERVRVAVEGITFIYRGKRVPISISVGVVAQVTQPHQPVPDFIAEADAALYRAKEAGRNRVMLAA